MNTHIPFPETNVPVMADYDVVVAGSGSSGICAALAAARTGVRVAIIEAYPNIGGTSTSGLPLLTTNDFISKQLSKGILEELMEALRKEGAFDGNLATDYYCCYDVDKYRLIVTRKLQEAGVDILTFTNIVGIKRKGDCIDGVVVYQKEGFSEIKAKVFIDCTGDADLAAFAGEPMLANEIDGQQQPPSLIFFAANIDTKAIDWPAIRKLWEELRPVHNWRNPRTGPAMSPPFSYPGKPGFHGFNVTRSLKIHATTTRDLVRMEIDQREQMDEFFYKFLKPYVPAFKNAFITGSNFVSGIRESRRIHGDFVLKGEDILKAKEFPDAVAWSAYPVDRHSATGGTTDYREEDAYLPGYYSVPFRIMIPQKTPNLLVSGKNISADEIAFSALRVMGTTMPLGEAAGIAAALMVQRGLDSKSIPYQEVRDILAERGAYMEPQKVLP